MKQPINIVFPIISYNTTYHTLSHLITPYHTLSHFITPYHYLRGDTTFVSLPVRDWGKRAIFERVIHIYNYCLDISIRLS